MSSGRLGSGSGRAYGDSLGVLDGVLRNSEGALTAAGGPLTGAGGAAGPCDTGVIGAVEEEQKTKISGLGGSGSPIIIASAARLC